MYDITQIQGFFDPPTPAPLPLIREVIYECSLIDNKQRSLQFQKIDIVIVEWKQKSLNEALNKKKYSGHEN